MLRSFKAQPGELQGGWERLGVYALFPLQCLMNFTKVIGHSINVFVGIPSNLLFIFLSIGRMRALVLDRHKNTCDNFVLFYLFYAIISGIVTFLYGFPFVCYVMSLKIFIFPILFYFWGRNSSDTSQMFYKIFILTCLIVMIVGLYLYITMPDFFSNYIIESYQNAWNKEGSEATESMVLERTRFSSFLPSSYSVCFFAVSSLTIALSFFFKNQLGLFFKSGKQNILLLYVMAGVFLISSILCMQRIAMVCSVAIVLFYSIYGMRRKNKQLGFLLIAFFFAGGAYLTYHVANERDAQIMENLLVRVSRLNMDDAMGARTDQYSFVFNDWFGYALGTGLGSAGNKAAELGYNGVTDGDFVRMYAELGFMGILVYLWIIVASIIRGIKYFKLYNMEVVVIIFFFLACVGANALSMGLWSGIFWYAIGRIWNNAYRKTNIILIK